MNETLKDLMRDATRLTRAGRLGEATTLLQQMLGQKSAERASQASQASPAPIAHANVLDGCVFEIDVPADEEAPPAPPRAATAPSAGQFLSGAHTHATLTRSYKLYVPPAAAAGKPLPLVVMLHGCTQDPDDFAAGTGMNELAHRQGFYVLYPAQSQDANPQRCWNWFKHNHQQRGRGEPALLASLTQAIVQSHAIDPAQVYIAGLSAGGAMAAIMGAAYPDIYAAVGVHSGLAPGAATNIGEALSAMNRGLAKQAQSLGVPTIVFHGDQDKTVSPVNGEQVMEARLSAPGASGATSRPEQGNSGKGRRFTRKVYQDGAGRVLGEHWLVHGAGHAWAGGSARGSYTDAAGPDASAEMVRFFFDRRNSA